MTPRAAELRAAAFFVFAGIAGIALLVAYWVDASTQWLGGLLAASFGGIAVGLVTWANRLMPQGPFEEAREALPSGGGAVEVSEASFEQGAEVLGRRKLLTRTLGFAAAATGVAALSPLRSLGPRPRKQLAQTPWETHRRAVTDDGKPVRAADLPQGGMVVIFPEGHPGSADGQAVLIRVDPKLLRPSPGRETWTPDGLIAYSRVCTHAGCPVGLYEADVHQLLCPCHQSAFDALHDAKPVFGPAAAPLPQLPLMIDEDGYVRARSDFPDPVGPAYWRRS